MYVDGNNPVVLMRLTGERKATGNAGVMVDELRTLKKILMVRPIPNQLARISGSGALEMFFSFKSLHDSNM